MLTRDCRPQVFEDVAGQELPVRVLKAIIANPEIAPKSLVLEGPFGTGKCQKSGTKLQSSLGYVDIDSLSKNRIPGFSPLHGVKVSTRFGEMPATQFYYEPNCKVYTMALDDGTEVNGTADHPLLKLTAKGPELVPVKDIHEGDILLKSVCEEHWETSADSGLDDEECYIAGLWVGDGWVSYRKEGGLKFGLEGEDRVLQFIKSLYPEKFGAVYDHSTNDKVKLLSVVKSSDSWGMRLFSPVKVDSSTKKVPELIYRGSRRQKLYFILGLLDSDGTFSGNKLDWCFKSKELRDGLKDILESIGIGVQLATKTINTGKYKGCTYYRLYVDLEGLGPLAELNEFVPSKKLDRIRQFRDNLSRANYRNCVEVTDEWVDAHRQVLDEATREVGTRPRNKKGYTSRDMFRNIYGNNCLRKISKMTIRLSCRKIECLQELLPYKPVHVLSKTETVEDVFDITVPGVHEFMSQGLANHNCVKPGTRIATPFGYLKIEDLCKKALSDHEILEGFCPVTDPKWSVVLGSTCVRKFQQVFRQNHVYVIDAQLENGELINGTPEHKVWVLGDDSAVEWKKMGDLVPGDYVLRNNAPLLYGDYIPQKHFKEFSQHVKHVRNGRYFDELELALEAILNAHPANRFSFYSQLFTTFHRKSITIKGPKPLVEWLDALCQSIGVIPEIDWKRLKIKIPRVKQISYNMSFDEDVGCECYGEGNQVQLKNSVNRFIASEHLEKFIEHGIETWNDVRASAFQDKDLQKYCRWTPMRVVATSGDFSDVYDVSMDEFHDFYAQGIINHNTTNARLFAKGLNCLSSGQKKPCGHCENCLGDLESKGFYVEYDSAIVGQVEKIRELRDTFYAQTSGYRVVCLDEFHLVSRQAQSALLKVLEEAPKSVFFLFCTTDPDKILETIRSRSMDLQLELVPEQKVYNSLKKIAEQKGIPASEEALNLIVTAAHGHMRNAHMLLDKLAMIGEEDLKLSLRSASDALFRYFEAVAQRNNTALFKSVEEVLTYPVSEVATSFLNEVRLLTRAMVGQENRYSGLAKSLGQDCLKLVKLCVSEWVTTSFVSDPQIEVVLICIFNLMMGSKPQSVSEPVQTNRFSRR